MPTHQNLLVLMSYRALTWTLKRDLQRGATICKAATELAGIKTEVPASYQLTK